MMQQYRHAKPHSAAECAECAPDRPGHRLCQHDGCDNLAEAQHRRHATQAEYGALPEHFKPIDGVAYQAVFTCFDHEIDPICGGEHHGAPASPDLYMVDLGGMHGASGLDVLKSAPAEPPCPKCGAGPGQPCVKANGKPRSTPHEERGQTTPSAPEPTCNHAHREDCGGQGNCACSADDPVPAREPRIVPPPVPAAPAPIHVPTHGEVQHFLADHGIDVARVLTLELVPSADGPIVLRAVLAVLDHHGNHVFDQHGQRQAEVREIRLTPTHSTDPAHLP